jgi:hypothetical protein
MMDITIGVNDVVMSPKNDNVLYRVIDQPDPEDGRVTLKVIAHAISGEIKVVRNGDEYTGIDCTGFIKLSGSK